MSRVDAAVSFADSSPFPPPESLYDHIYVLENESDSWYSVDERAAGVHRGEDERKLPADQRGPEVEYRRAVDAAKRGDDSNPKPADEAQAGRDGADSAEKLAQGGEG